MTQRFRITLAQLDPTVGDIAGNADKVRAAHEEARAAGADLLILPEMFLAGYQPRDLVLRPAFVAHVAREMAALASITRNGPAIAVGGPHAEDGRLYNGYWILARGRVETVVHKHNLPNEEVFDECRYFTPGAISGPVPVGPVRVGFPICEDAWHPDVAETLAESGAEILIVPNGSPYHRGKQDLRLAHMVARVVENQMPLVYLNMVGAEDDQVFDGASFALDLGGRLAAQLPAFDEVIAHLDFEETAEGWRPVETEKAVLPSPIEMDYRAMVESLRGYFRKTGFRRALLGLSGGIDSSMVASIAADALGPENVRCVMLPSPYTSRASLEDAAAVAGALGCRLDEVPITGPFAAVEEALAPLFAGTEPDVTEENIQARLRGLLLMAISNKFGELLLTTGNKSELAVGYATLYGDMCGVYNPLKDLFKMRVYATARWRNAHHRPWMKGPAGRVIPERVLEKAPSAELRPGQKDEDSLPPYKVLDDILAGLVEEDAAVADLVARGHDITTVRRVENMLYNAEFKRHQAAPGTRLTRRSFTLDWRYPIVNRWRDPG